MEHEKSCLKFTCTDMPSLSSDSKQEKERALSTGFLKETFILKDTTEWRTYSIFILRILGSCAVVTVNCTKVSPENSIFECFL